MAVECTAVGTAGSCESTADTDLVLGRPGSSSAGDVLVAVFSAYYTAGTDRSPSCSGWTLVSASGDAQRVWVMYKIDDGSEPDTYTITFNTTYAIATGVALRFTGATTTGLSVGTVQFRNDTDATVPLPDMTVSSDGSGLIWFGHRTLYDARCSSCSRANAVERYDGREDADAWVLWVYTEDNVSSGSLTSNSFTLASTAFTKYGMAVLIPPAAAAGGGSPLLLMDHFNGGVAL